MITFFILNPICKRFSIEFLRKFLCEMYQHICRSSYRGSQNSPTPESSYFYLKFYYKVLFSLNSLWNSFPRFSNSFYQWLVFLFFFAGQLSVSLKLFHEEALVDLMRSYDAAPSVPLYCFCVINEESYDSNEDSVHNHRNSIQNVPVCICNNYKK